MHRVARLQAVNHNPAGRSTAVELAGARLVTTHDTRRVGRRREQRGAGI
jgi:hypothetical protein